MQLSLLCFVLLIPYTAVVANIEVHEITGDHNETDKVPIITGCHRRETVPVPTHDMFSYLQQQYRLSVGLEHSTIETPGETGIMVPHEFRISPGKGRGVFVTADVPKGTVIRKRWGKTAVFPNERTFRQFLKSLSWEMACDVITWTYPDYIIEDDSSDDEGCDDSCDSDEYDEYYVHMDIDGGCLVNHGDETDANLGCDNNVGLCYALDDIKGGSEILIDYGDMDGEDLPWFDKIYKDAWVNDPFGWGETEGSNEL